MVTSNSGLSWSGVNSITADANGIYVAGYDDNGGKQWRIEKYDLTTGSLTCSVTSNPSAGADQSYAITSDASGIYVAGTDNSPGNQQWRIEKYDLCGAGLPVELLSFDATPIKQSEDAYIVRCTWATATEINNDYFTVENSKDGINFSQIVGSTTPGAGNSSTTLYYKYDDEFPFFGLSYYRLKQTDFDGKYSYSNIVSVFIGRVDIINFYPNPVIDYVSAEIAVQENTSAAIEVFNTLGERVYIKEEQLTKGLTQIKIDISKLAKGNYLFRVILPSKEKTQKVFVKFF